MKNFLLPVVITGILFSQEAIGQQAADCESMKKRMAELEKQHKRLESALDPDNMEKRKYAYDNIIILQDYQEDVKRSDAKMKEDMIRISKDINFNLDECLKSTAKGKGSLNNCADQIRSKLLLDTKDYRVDTYEGARVHIKSIENEMNTLRANMESCGSPANISGAWKCNTDWTYTITQKDTAFSWSMPKFNEKGKGKITGNSVSATWSGTNGSGSASGTVYVDESGKALEIKWKNGIVFERN